MPQRRPAFRSLSKSTRPCEIAGSLLAYQNDVKRTSCKETADPWRFGGSLALRTLGDLGGLLREWCLLLLGYHQNI